MNVNSPGKVWGCLLALSLASPLVASDVDDQEEAFPQPRGFAYLAGSLNRACRGRRCGVFRFYADALGGFDRTFDCVNRDFCDVAANVGRALVQASRGAVRR